MLYELVVPVLDRKGGPGSGHHGHGGRPGKRGGSSAARGSSRASTPTFSESANVAASNFAPTLGEATKLMRKEKKDWDEFELYMSSEEKAKAAGMDEGMVSSLDQVWNESTHSLAQSQMQKLAADEFGANFPDWQKKQLKGFTDERERRLAAGEELTLEHMTATERQWEHVERVKAGSKFFAADVAHLEKPSDLWGKYDSEEAASRAYMRSSYESTQAALAKAGISEISVYRGVRGETPVGAVGDHVKITKQAALVSWTPSLKDATYFAKLKKTKQGVRMPPSGTIISTTIPARRILSVGWTGLGVVEEKEFVVFGGEQDVAAVHSTY